MLTEKEYKRSIVLEGGFKSWKQILEEKFQLLRQKLRQRQAAQLVSHDKIKTTIKEKRKEKKRKKDEEKEYWGDMHSSELSDVSYRNKQTIV